MYFPEVSSTDTDDTVDERK